MKATARRMEFRALLAGSACVHPASVYDPISARIAEDLGFSCAILAGSTAALAVLGSPDIVVLTLTEFADLACRITRGSNIPLLVDADHGYGNAFSAMRTVIELERSGVAALTLEDTHLPQPFGTTSARLISREEAQGKLRAALIARTDPQTVIIGRTSAIGIAGLDEAMERARLFTEAGADALFFTGVESLDMIRALRKVSELPIILGGPELTDFKALTALGVRISLRGHQPIQAAIRAVHDTMLALRDGTPLPTLAGQPLMAQVTRAADYATAGRDFAGHK